MTRRDRAALALALECLRADGSRPVVEALRALDLGCRDAQWLKWAIEERDSDGDTSFAYGHIGTRLLRARLALLLRALLRADAIEREDWWPCYAMRSRIVCAGCGDIILNYDRGEKTTGACPRTGRIETTRYAIPLWEQARRHEP